MVCPNCGMENEEDAKVCVGCEISLDKKKHSLGRDFAWASMVLGIWGIVIFPYIYGTLAVLAGLMARRQDYRGKMAPVGIFLGIIGVLAWILFRFI